MEVSSEELKVIAGLVHDLCGIVLDESKGYLIKSRLTTLAREEGCGSFLELHNKVRRNGDQALRSKVVDAMTTRETLWFRDGAPFEALQFKVLPEVIDSKSGTAFSKRLRIWSAACSTGQEPYSIAIVLQEMLPDYRTWDIQILATDISDAAIKQANLGIYAEHEIRRGLTPARTMKYFTQMPTGWRIKDETRSLVTFRRLNLLEPIMGIGPFDVIFCRNVAIYFSAQVRRDLFLRLSRLLSPRGYLFAGSSESLSDLGPQFTPQHHCRAVFYQPTKLGAPAKPGAPVLVGA